VRNVERRLNLRIVDGEIEFELEELCWNCFGKGTKQGQECEFCNGNGYLPTDEGRKVLEFLKRHWRIQLEVKDTRP
jgi:hypothetical protein